MLKQILIGLGQSLIRCVTIWNGQPSMLLPLIDRNLQQKQNHVTTCHLSASCQSPLDITDANHVMDTATWYNVCYIRLVRLSLQRPRARNSGANIMQTRLQMSFS